MITLKTLPKATAQEVFDQVAEHLLTQGKKSLDFKRCAYRSPNGLKCAAGCLISDDEYRLAMEGRNWWGLVNSTIVPDTHTRLIDSLQGCHDFTAPSEWGFRLVEISTGFRLSADIVHKHMGAQFNPHPDEYSEASHASN